MNKAMLIPASADLPRARPLPPPRRRRRGGPSGSGIRLLAFGIAIAVQLGLGLLLFWSGHVLLPPGEHVVELVLEETPKPPPDPPPPIPPPPVPAPLHPLTPLVPAIQIAPVKPPPPPVPTTSTAAPVTVVAQPPPPQAAAPGVEDAFKAAVRAAVFAAHRVPDSARLLALFGETRVSFTLSDRGVGDIRLVASSGHDVLDQAALAAVRGARYPSMPEALRGRSLSFEITLYRRADAAQ